jgi:flagellar assembly protein FliH
VRPWEQESLRPSAPKNISAVLADLTAAGGSEAAETSRPHSKANARSAAEEAEQILQHARAEAERLRTGAIREGYADGQARALEENSEEKQRLRELLAALGEAYRGFCLSQAPGLAALAATAAEKLLYEQLSLEPARVLVIVQQALEQAVGSAPITVYLNPADVELVRGHLMSDPRQSSSVQLAAAPEVERGGCWIENDQGNVDATVSGRLSRLKDLLGEGYARDTGTRTREGG